MTKTAEYIKFEEGFLKEAELHGCDVPFLRGYIKEADEIVEIWKEAFDELAEKSGDPLYRFKLAQEICYLNQIKPILQKQAGIQEMLQHAPAQYQQFLGGMNQGGMSDIQNKLQQFIHGHEGGMGGGIMKWLSDALQQNPNMLSSLTTGAGGGGLLGLLLGAAMGHPGMGLMLGGLGGAGLGAYEGNQGVQTAAKDAWNSYAQPKVDQVGNMLHHATQSIGKNDHIGDSTAPTTVPPQTPQSMHMPPPPIPKPVAPITPPVTPPIQGK